MQFAVWILERCIDLMPPGTEQLALLINFDHKSRNPTSIANAKLMLYILQNHYVERLGIALCINGELESFYRARCWTDLNLCAVPWVFKMFWNAIQAFIDPVTKSKCKFDEAIKDEVPSRQLSSEFGGALDSTYNHEEYWSDLVKLTGERRKEMMRRFKEDCNSEVGASEWVIRGGDDETSPFATKGQEVATSDVGTSSMSSGIPSSGDPAAGEKARSAAVVASDSRAEQSRTPRYEEPETPLSETPLSRFMTPSDTLNAGPLDRTVSSIAAGNDKKAQLTTTEEKPQEEEEQTKKERPHSGLHNLEEKFKGFNYRIAHVFQHDTSRKSSREGLRESKDSIGPNGDKAKAAEIDRKENVETVEELRTKGSLPSAAEVAGVAGAAGMGGAVGAVGGSHGEKVQDGAASAPEKGSIHVLYFASAKEAAGIGRQDIVLPEIPFPLAKLGEHLTQLVADSGKGDAKSFGKVLETSKWSVDEDMVDEDGLAKMTLSGGEDVAIIPPVSGG
jgi:molybdopterin converting factor small subunit